MITDINQLDFSKRYTYSDYLTWQFRERVELIKGKIFKMSPAPNRRHQKISIKLSSGIYYHLSNNLCDVYEAPFDVKLIKGDESTIVQPDICVICDYNKLTDFGCEGAPELIIEILSPGNSRKEMKEKFELYEENGVQEYWMVNPLEQAIFIYTLVNGTFQSLKPLVPGEKAISQYLKGFEVEVTALFTD